LSLRRVRGFLLLVNISSGIDDKKPLGSMLMLPALPRGVGSRENWVRFVKMIPRSSCARLSFDFMATVAAALTPDLSKRSQSFSRQIVPRTPAYQSTIATTRMVARTDAHFGAPANPGAAVFCEIGS
jgi:hypothetical protein